MGIVNRLLQTSILLLQLISTVLSALQCRDQNGNAVDWFIVYKLPKLRHQTGTLFGDGLEFFYMDSNHPEWLLSPIPINESDQAIAYTLNQIYQDKSSEVNYFMYNDEKPSHSVSLNHGHTKGTLGFDTQSGFWLIHSAPSFPPEKVEGYQWAESASDYGQSFLCVTFLYSTLGVLGKQLVINYPQVYDKFLSNAVVSDYQILSDVGERPSEQFPVSNVEHFSSKDGVLLTSFAKFTTFGADLYDGLVAPTLKEPLLVETWRNGPKSDLLPSNCSGPYKVYNILQVDLPGNVFFDVHKDHSKYVVSLPADSNWVCVGDINRETTQFKRGGGTLCFQHPDVWKSFMKCVTFFEPCPPSE